MWGKTARRAANTQGEGKIDVTLQQKTNSRIKQEVERQARLKQDSKTVLLTTWLQQVSIGGLSSPLWNSRVVIWIWKNATSVSSKGVKCNFWLNYPIKLLRFDSVKCKCNPMNWRGETASVSQFLFVLRAQKITAKHMETREGTLPLDAFRKPFSAW